MKLVEYLRVKVARLATPEVFEVSRTLIRGLAKDGLMEDGKEDLLPRPFTVSVKTQLAHCLNQWAVFEPLVISLANGFRLI